MYYIGANYWYGGVLALKKDKQKGINRLKKELDFLKLHGVNNLRVLAGAEGSGLINGVNRVGPPLQIEEGIFDTGYLKGMDVLLSELGKRKMTAVIYLSNNWNWSGGFLQYLQWNNLISAAAFNEEIPWSELGEYTSRFYTCEKCIADYLNQVKYVIAHTNSITHKKYSEEPAIMAWEIANEPRPMRHSVIDSYKKFISNAASFIKSLDGNHLITTGTEGYMSTESIQLYKDIHDDKNIDYLTIHIWPKNWAWFENGKMAEQYAKAEKLTRDYIAEHIRVAKKLNKPLVIEEFGLPRDAQSFDISAKTKLRDRYFQTVFSYIKSEPFIAGANFWAFGGTARPIKDQLFWKAGDDYMGDPPMEEQGLYSIFDKDRSTWKVISRSARRLRP